MGLEFKQDAICLSGLAGSRLKCEVLGQYYPFWWSITSGGPGKQYKWSTAIVELDAATGEVYIEDTEEIILGSSGHALELKCCNLNTGSLKVILVEKDVGCYGHLKAVIKRRWSNVDIGLAERDIRYNPYNIYLLNTDLENALNHIDKMKLGNALFLSDPLRSVEYKVIEKVAKNRMKEFYQTGTEFIIFIFTSDWFLGRDDFHSLPTTINGLAWSVGEKSSVLEADVLFGNQEWRRDILNNSPIDERENCLIELYKNRLHEWFRYVLPMPFNPKGDQIFHLILCSNFETGVRATKKFYCDLTGNIEYKPNNKQAYSLFRNHHPEIFRGLSRNRRPLQWRLLWYAIIQHEEGICDYLCKDFNDIEKGDVAKQNSLEWLENEGYIKLYRTKNIWKLQITQYNLNWQTIQEKLEVNPPLPLKPLSLKPLSLKEINRQ